MLHVDYLKELEDRVIMIRTTQGGYTVFLLEKMANGKPNAIPVRMKTEQNFKKALEVAEAWEELNVN